MVFCVSFLRNTSIRASNSADNYQTANSTFELGRRGSTSNPQNGSHTTQEGATTPLVPNKNLRVFKLDELKEATNNFSEMIGEGGYGKVHKGIVQSSGHSSNGIEVAVKRGKRGQKGYKQWVTEVNVLGDDKLQHPNLVKLIGYCDENHENESNWLLVYEYMPNGSLDDHLSGKLPPPSWANRLKIAKDAATGLAYLHEGLGKDKQIVFRDFKPPNILLDNEWNAKLSDFGFAREGPQDGRTHVSTVAVGTKGYAAPEYVQTGRMSFQIDVWSYGIFLEELITGKRPVAQKYSERNPQFLRWCCCYAAGDEKSKIIVDQRLADTYSERSMEKLISTAKKCLAKEPRSRPKMSEVLEMVKEAIALQDHCHFHTLSFSLYLSSYPSLSLEIHFLQRFDLGKLSACLLTIIKLFTAETLKSWEAMRCFHFSDCEKDQGPKTPTKSLSVQSFTSLFTDRRSWTGFNSQIMSDASTESVGRSNVPSFSQRPTNLRVFTFSELKSATNGFSRSAKIGEGGFGSVFMGSIKSTQDPPQKIRGHKEWVTEVNVLGVVEHPNLVKLVGYCAEDDERGIQRLLVYE
ncbi:hypothetical protein OSB04_009529 [Centaurea solstitialis]|uniref:Protein kinase domain-containing protein n=1 Tax=Centaurea solstitialis TaxID=347529 RepID=A0AA38WJS7_9ASTR|nr:hypothetical protein OSB04_009529 [Centaurea solstitialis]